MINHDEVMRMAAAEAEKTMTAGIGGPFGAAIVKDGEIVSVASNTVLGDHDPTAHAEVNAIRKACRKMGTHDLSGCEIYATGSPCPMCMSSIIWANIKKVYISGLPEDADAIGFRDKFMYDFIEDGCQDENVVKLEKLDRETAQELYRKYQDNGSEIY